MATATRQDDQGNVISWRRRRRRPGEYQDTEGQGGDDRGQGAPDQVHNPCDPPHGGAHGHAIP